MADGPLGVRNFRPATAFAGGIALAATWNPQLVGRSSEQIELRGKLTLAGAVAIRIK